MALAIGSLLLGAVLGLWFEVLVLIPVVLLAALVIGIDAWAHSFGLGRTLVMIFVSAIALEIGYLGGAGAFVLISKARRFKAARFVARTSKRSLPLSGPRGV
jgi:hypothetical protein